MAKARRPKSDMTAPESPPPGPTVASDEATPQFRPARRYAALALLLTLVAPLGASGQEGTVVLVRSKLTSPGVSAKVAAPTAEDKLTPDLAAVVAAKEKKAKFVGVTVAGEVAVEFAGEVGLEAATAALAEAPRGIDVRQEPHPQVLSSDRLLVVYSGDKAPAVVGGFKAVDTHEPGRFVVVESKGGFTAEAIEKVASDPQVRMVQPNYQYTLQLQQDPTLATPKVAATTPNDPLFSLLWGMRKVNAPWAWDRVKSSPVRVAVIDTGLSLGHKDIKANIVLGLSKDFTTDGTPEDGHGHGTHCAGTIGAVGNNQAGVVGVMWKCQMFGCKIFNKTGGFAGDVQVAKAIDYALGQKAKVLSNSWGGGAFSPVLKAAIDRAEQKGTLFVAAAGNTGTNNDALPHYPSSYSNKNIIAVAATDSNDLLAPFSCYGKTSVDIAAPGVGIHSTVLNNAYGSKSGTSMATPHVAGAAALVWGHPQYAKHTAVQIKTLLMAQSRKVASLTGKCVSGGVLDLRFVASLSPVPLGTEYEETPKP